MATSSFPPAVDPIARAAALLDAVARDSERAVDFDVPLHCGQAAHMLHATPGFGASGLPDGLPVGLWVGDVAADIAAAVAEAISLLAGLPPERLTQFTTQALAHARAADAAVHTRAVP